MEPCRGVLEKSDMHLFRSHEQLHRYIGIATAVLLRCSSEVRKLRLFSPKCIASGLSLSRCSMPESLVKPKIYQGVLQGISGGQHSARTSHPAAGRTPCRSEFIQMADPRKGSSPPKRPRTEKCRRYIPRRTAANLVNTMFSRS